uniref:Uncharacterized protein n=1 Tax=Zea mays TaxID=4577 RepID=C4J5M1_MAIZE|nr:unknown [Zea mays]
MRPQRPAPQLSRHGVPLHEVAPALRAPLPLLRPDLPHARPRVLLYRARLRGTHGREPGEAVQHAARRHLAEQLLGPTVEPNGRGPPPRVGVCARARQVGTGRRRAGRVPNVGPAPRVPVLVPDATAAQG